VTIAEQYADYALGLSYEDLPPEVVAHTKKLILDIMANAIGGHEWSESGPSILAGVRKLNRAGTGATVLVTGEQMAPEWASLANGSFSHSLDYDNHHAKGVIHAGSSVVNTALAAGEENGSSGKDLIAAVVVGYEIACRLAMALGPHSSHEMGFHPTGTCAAFSSSAIVAKLRGQSANEIVNAMGLNGSQAAGSMQYVLNGAWNKRTHTGLAPHAGFIAATLASTGFIGAAEVFEGTQGFLQGYALRPKPEAATATLGSSFETMEVAIKPYSLCRYTHQTLDLLLGMTNDHPIDPTRVRSVVIDMPTYGVQLCGSPIEAKRNPTSSVDAQFSGPFAAALAITERKAGMNDFAGVLGRGLSDEFKRIMSVTDVHQADDLDAIHPEFWPGRVTIDVGGEVTELYSKHMLGEKERPMSMEQVQAKFAELSPNHDEATRQAVYAAIDNLENLTTIDLVTPLRKA